jgi:hypothetical protein
MSLRSASRRVQKPIASDIAAKRFLVPERRTVFSHLDRIGNFDSPNRLFGFYYCRVSLAGPLAGDFCNKIGPSLPTCALHKMGRLAGALRTYLGKAVGNPSVTWAPAHNRRTDAGAALCPLRGVRVAQLKSRGEASAARARLTLQRATMAPGCMRFFATYSPIFWPMSWPTLVENR